MQTVCLTKVKPARRRKACRLWLQICSEQVTSARAALAQGQATILLWRVTRSSQLADRMDHPRAAWVVQMEGSAHEWRKLWMDLRGPFSMTAETTFRSLTKVRNTLLASDERTRWKASAAILAKARVGISPRLGDMRRRQPLSKLRWRRAAQSGCRCGPDPDGSRPVVSGRRNRRCRAGSEAFGKALRAILRSMTKGRISQSGEISFRRSALNYDQLVDIPVP